MQSEANSARQMVRTPAPQNSRILTTRAVFWRGQFESHQAEAGFECVLNLLSLPLDYGTEG